MKVILLLATLFSLSIVGVDVMFPMLSDGATSELSDEHRLFFWVASIFALGFFTYEIGLEDGKRSRRPK